MAKRSSPQVQSGKGGGPTPFVNAFDNSTIQSLRYNTSQDGSVIPLIWGCQRATVNLIYIGQLTGGPKSGKGGKGGLTSSSKKTGNYTVFVQMALCTGPVSFVGSPGAIGGNNRIWSNGGIAAGLGHVGLDGYNGSDGQTPNPAFNGFNPFNPGYSGTAHLDGAPMQLGGSPALPDLSMEVTGFQLNTAGPDYGAQANPQFIIQDILSDPRVGAGFPSGLIDSTTFDNYGIYCIVNNFAMSLIMDKQQQTSQWIDELLKLTVADIAWVGYTLKIKPYSLTSVVNFGYTFTPDTTIVYSLNDLDFIPYESSHNRTATQGKGSTDPVTIIRKDPSTVTNWLSLEYMPLDNSYNPDIVSAWDQGFIDKFGVKEESSIQAHEYTIVGPAQSAANMMLSRKISILNTYKFKIGWQYLLLEPLDIVELTDSNAGLVNKGVRVTDIEEDENGILQITAEDLPSNIPQALPSFTPASHTGEVVVDVFADPGDANPPVIFEPPTTLTNGVNVIWLVTSGGDDWGGAIVSVSLDGSSYRTVGTINRGCRQGVLTAILPAFSGTNPDTADTLSVDMTESDAQLLSGTSGDASSFVTLCVIDDELLSYETATLTSTFMYNLTTLYRGAYSTPPASHAIGALFARLDGSQFEITFPNNLIPTMFYVKLQSFNLVGTNLQDISDVEAYTYTTTGSGSSTSTNFISGSFSGTPTSNQQIFSYVSSMTQTIPANLGGSVANASTAPTGTVAFQIEKNGTPFGTMTFASGSHTATFASTSSETLNSGDVLTIVAPTTLASIAGLSWTLESTY